MLIKHGEIHSDSSIEFICRCALIFLRLIEGRKNRLYGIDLGELVQHIVFDGLHAKFGLWMVLVHRPNLT